MFNFKPNLVSVAAQNGLCPVCSETAKRQVLTSSIFLKRKLLMKIFYLSYGFGICYIKNTRKEIDIYEP